MSSDENHRRWFLDQLNEQAHSLSDEQLWTLMVWALGATLAWRGIGKIRDMVHARMEETRRSNLPHSY